MSNHYEVGMSADGTYVYVRNIRQGITLDLALSFTRDFTALGESSDIRRCLIDVRGTTSIAGVMGMYDYAYNKAVTAGLTRKWRVALLKDTRPPLRIPLDTHVITRLCFTHSPASERDTDVTGRLLRL
jgi:hypothetical protein